MSDNFDLDYQNDQERKPFLSFIPRKLRIILILILCTSIFIALLIVTQPQAKKRPIPETVVTVEVVEASRADYPILVNANGTIQADIRGDLVSQIRGEIVSMSANFKTGGVFSAGDILIEVDQRDYLAEVSQALSAVSQAKASLQQEEALAKQAKTDWKRLGNTGTPPALVARQPQVAAAKAGLESASARYETAKLNLDRTKIKAPYTGRVIQRNAVLGQYVAIGTRLAEIFATDAVEVRLPVSQEEYRQLGLDQLNKTNAPEFAVKISNELGSNTYYWDAKVTRTDSTFDLTTRQIDVIAEVIDPFSDAENKPPLKIGQFVNASIQGRTLENVIALPNKSLREGRYVFTSKNDVLVRTPVQLAWQDDQNSVISQGLEAGDIVVTTSLNSTLAGAKVKYDTPPSAASTPDTMVDRDSSASELPNSDIHPEDLNSPEPQAELTGNTVEAASDNALEQMIEAPQDSPKDVVESALENIDPKVDAPAALEISTPSE